MWGAIIPAAASLIGGALSSDAAGSAADAQAQSSAASIAEQRRQYDLTRADNAPFLQTGTAANRRLAVLLGLQPTATPTTPAQGYEQAVGQMPTREQFTSAAGNQEDAGRHTTFGRVIPGGTGGFDQPAYDAAITDYNARKTRFDGATPSTPPTPDTGYGELLRKFSLADRDADPVYQSGLQFGLDEGTKGINARAIASGGYDSGATLKALTRYGNDYGSTKANESYNRYTADQNNIYNKLAGISGSGQVASNQVAAAGTNAANNVSGSINDAGNARAAGIVGGANAWGNALTGGVNSYQNNQILQQLLKKRGGGYGGTTTIPSGVNFEE